MIKNNILYHYPNPCNLRCFPLQKACRRVKPCRGYFSDVDPNAEVKPINKKQDFDVNKRESFADFIWNTDWASYMDAEKEEREARKMNKDKTSESSQGFLSLSRAAILNDVHVDLSEQLKPRPQEVEGIPDENVKSKTFDPPTSREVSEWERSTKFASPVVPGNLTLDEKQSVEQDMDNYNKENIELIVWNLSLTTISFMATYAFYSQDVALSYVVGSFGGLLYLRLLKKGVEGIGGNGGISSLAAQPRLLVPVVLVMAFNRWNTLAADTYGVHLELLPMLVGFFTYKAAVISRQGIVLFRDFVKDIKNV